MPRRRIKPTEHILDTQADTATLGKTAGKDAEQNKPTYVSILGLERARILSRELHGNALAALADYPADSRRLTELANFIMLRSF